MDFAIKFAFDILAFTSVMVLIVLGLGVIASMMGAGIFTTSGFIARDRLSNALRKR